MTIKQKFLLSISILVLMVLFIYTIFSKHGYSDLALLKQEQRNLVQNNEELTRKNFALSIEIDRLKNDLVYIENIARQELGMIREDEYILKPKNQSDWKK